jgi:hypothetical protein
MTWGRKICFCGPCPQKDKKISNFLLEKRKFDKENQY